MLMSSTSAAARRLNRRPEPGADALGALGGLCAVLAYAFLLYGLVDESLLAQAHWVAALGAVGALASALGWRRGSRGWKTTLGVGSAWLPLVAGLVLVIVSAAT